MKDHDRIMRQWSHNALFGAAGMIESCADRILRSETSTELAKGYAEIIKRQIPYLKIALKTRVDP